MLVLARRLNERVLFWVPDRENPIIVQVAALKPEQCRLGITADPDIQIWREEIATARQLATLREHDHA